MKRWRVTARLATPVLVSGGEDQQYLRRCLDYLPGAAMRGSLARDFLLRRGCLKHAGRGEGRECPECSQVPDCPFPKVFLGEEAVLFGDLRFAAAGVDEAYAGPRSMLKTKYRKSEAAKVDWLRQKLRGEPRPQAHEKNPWDAWKKPLWRRGKAYEEGKEPQRQIFSRTALDRWTERAAESQLYSLQAMVPQKDAFFLGLWRVPDPAQPALEEILRDHRDKEDKVTIWIGGGRSRGWGEVEITYEETSSDEVAERLATFQEEVAPQDGYRYFSLDLQGPLSCPDGLGELVPRDAADFRAWGFHPPDGLELVPQGVFTELEEQGGWSLAWGMPRTQEQVIAAGSVLTYRVPASAADWLRPFLAALEERGLGRRTAAGWGAVVACAPWHWELRQEG